ncbi:MAG: hypothetical protein QOD06_3175 [Candidatus Binatota bacterium]|jgi:hypothetical protein|nr:hypothetical protein [Candidatus Binatota bacterium]
MASRSRSIFGGRRRRRSRHGRRPPEARLLVVAASLGLIVGAFFGMRAISVPPAGPTEVPAAATAVPTASPTVEESPLVASVAEPSATTTRITASPTRESSPAPSPTAPAPTPTATASPAPSPSPYVSQYTVLIPGPDRDRLWRLAPRGSVEFSVDGGRNWKKQRSGVTVDLLTGAAPADTVCWLAGRRGTVLRTQDAGGRWQRMPFPETTDLVRITSRGAQAATVTTVDRRRFTTTNGGKTWNEESPAGTAPAPR